RPMYRKDNGDTIILYTWGGSIAEDLKTFKKSTNQVGFNIYRYPVKVQNNGTVVVNRMAKQTYVWRSDTLYLLDEYNKSAADAHSKLTNAHWAKEISTEEYKKKLKEFDESKFPYEPQFKIIYFKGIFEKGKSYQFVETENFRSETVEL